MPALAIGVVLFSTFLHAWWNVLAKGAGGPRPTGFLNAGLVLATPGVLVVAITEVAGVPILGHVWAPLLGAGLCQGVYFVGLSYGYQNGDLSVVYPITRALPVLLLGVADSLIQRTPSAIGWAGLALVAAGCVVVSRPPSRPSARHPSSPSQHGELPRTSRRRQLAGWAQPQVLWAAVAALGTVGYTVFDKRAAEVMAASTGGGLPQALRYGLAEIVLSTAVLAGMLLVSGGLRRADEPAESPGLGRARRARTWSRSVVIGLLIFGAYGLVLWAYQLAERASYIVALRQFSIVLAVIAGAVMLREAAPGRRITAALIITAGVGVVALAP